MSNKNRNQQQQTTAAPVVEDKKEDLLALQVKNALEMGFAVETNEAGEPQQASKGEAKWVVDEGDFGGWVKRTMDASGAEKVEATSQGPQGDKPEGDKAEDQGKTGPLDEAPVGDLPENPNGEGTGGELKEEARPGLIVEVNDNNEVVDVRRAEGEVDLAADGVQLSAFQTRLAWIEAHGTTHEKYVKNVLTNYVEVCTKSVDLEKISVEQKRLWRLFAYLHAHPGEFSKLYNIVIEFGREYKDELFNLHMFFRAQEGLALGKDEMQCFNNLRSLVLNTVESKRKQAVKAILDIRKIVDHPLIPEHVRGMYVAYYQ